MPTFGLSPGWYWASDGTLVECQVLIVRGEPVRAYDMRGESIPVLPHDVMLRQPEEDGNG